MDRELRVMKGGYELAELIYNYDRPGSGMVKIKINRIIDLSDDMKSTYPLLQFESHFHHPEFTTLEELKEFDKQQLNQHRDFTSELDDSIEYLYEPMVFRYLITQRETIGIADIKADFNGNKKEMQFISARSQREDCNFLASDSLQINHSLLTGFFEQYLNLYGTEYLRIGSN